MVSNSESIDGWARTLCVCVCVCVVVTSVLLGSNWAYAIIVNRIVHCAVACDDGQWWSEWNGWTEIVIDYTVRYTIQLQVTMRNDVVLIADKHDRIPSFNWFSFNWRTAHSIRIEWCVTICAFTATVGPLRFHWPFYRIRNGRQMAMEINGVKTRFAMKSFNV